MAAFRPRQNIQITLNVQARIGGHFVLMHQRNQEFQRFQCLRLIQRAAGQVVTQELTISHMHPHKEGLPIALPIAARV